MIAVAAADVNRTDGQPRGTNGGTSLLAPAITADGVADELAFIRTLHTDEFNHGPAQLFLLTGFGRFGRPSIGSWLNYGLGSTNDNLPGFVVMMTGKGPSSYLLADFFNIKF